MKLLSLVKSVALESISVPESDALGETVKNRAAWALPYVLEYLLVEFPVAVYVDIEYTVSDKTIPEVLRKAARTGEVVVPGEDYVGRTSKLNPAVGEMKFPVLVYTRSGFVERIKPHLDCRRGITCDDRKMDRPKPESIMKRGTIALYKTDPKIRSRLLGYKSESFARPLLENFFEFLNPKDMERIRDSRKVRIGIGIDVAPKEDVSEFLKTRFNSLIGAINDQSHGNLIVIIYMMNFSPSKNDELKTMLLNFEIPNEIYVRLTSDAATSAAGHFSELSSISAFQDGCDHFFHFGLGSDIPSASTNWLESVVRWGLPRPAPLILVTFINGDGEIWLLREIVGSIHGALAISAMNPTPLIVVVASNISKGNQEMIKLWQHVEFQDLQQMLFGAQISTLVNMEQGEVRIAVMEILVQRYGSALWISSRVIIRDTTSLEEMRKILVSKGLVLGQMSIDNKPPSIVMEGYDDVAFQRIHGNQLECIKGISCSGKSSSQYRPLDYDSIGDVYDAAKVFHLQSLLPKPVNEEQRSQQYCHLSIRPEIMYNPVAFAHTNMTLWARGEVDSKILAETGKIKIAFLIPSKNKAGMEAMQAPFVNTFLPSMMQSILEDEWDRFQYSIYIGYDQDDPLLDKRRDELQSVIDAILGVRKSSVLIKYHLLPTAKCITLLWNILFIDAVRDGNDYYYQVNDDVALETPGWSTVFVKAMHNNDDFGVVGPNDHRWQCQLLTQSFVSRKHHDIFHWYFPMETKDWYSDNWISSVYGPGSTHCQTKYMIRNGAAGTRYNICSQPRWREAVTEGQRRIAAWRHERNEEKIDKSKSNNPAE